MSRHRRHALHRWCAAHPLEERGAASPAAPLARRNARRQTSLRESRDHRDGPITVGFTGPLARHTRVAPHAAVRSGTWRHSLSRRNDRPSGPAGQAPPELNSRW